MLKKGTETSPVNADFGQLLLASTSTPKTFFEFL
jgi:hypothetical protein